MGNENHNAGLVQPDYATKPVTALRDVVLNAISFVNKGANGKRFFLFKNEEGTGDAGLLEYSPLFKSANPTDTDWEVAYCVIAVPGEVDKQKDVWTEEEIVKASEEFLQSNAVLNFNHGTMDSVGRLTGSIVAPADFTVQTADGETETIAKGTWYITVRPNEQIKKMMKTGEITGMSVQGSARREAYDGSAAPNGVEKADKDNRAIPAGATGEGIKRVQHLLGLEETEVYDDATEAALAEYMEKKGVPGIPTLATLKLLLSEQPTSAPVEAAPVAPEVPAAPGGPVAAAGAPVEEAEKHVGAPYNPAKTNANTGMTSHPNVQDGVNVGAAPGNLGLRAQDLSVDSTADDLKAALGQSLQEGNESLAEYMEENYAGSQVGDLYGRNLSHAELWYMYSKFVGGGNKPTIDAQGNLVQGGGQAEVDKGAWTGSHGGHDPDAHNGNAYNFVRTFGEWARNDVDVAAKKLLKHGVVKTKQAAYRLAAWLADQYRNTTKWREGNKANLVHKGDDLAALCAEIGEDHNTVLAGLNSPELLAAESAEKAVLSETGEKPVTNEVAEKPVTTEAPAEDKNGAALKRVAAILRAGGSTENVMAQISESLKNKPVGMDGALPALKTAITRAAAAPEGEREALIEDIVEDFSRYLSHSNKKNALAKSFDSFSETHVTEDAPANPTNSPLGEEMDRAYIEENRDNLSAAAEFITSILAGQSSTEAPAAEVAEVEKDVEEVKEAPAEVEAPETPEAPAETEGDVAEEAKEELDDEGEDVTEDELVQVLNHVVETMDSFESRLSQLESLEKKLDQVGELAKALDVTGDIDVLRANVEEISKSLAAAASSDELEAVRKSVEDIASTPSAPSSLPVEAAPAPKGQVEEVVKSNINPNDAASIWGGTFR